MHVGVFVCSSVTVGFQGLSLTSVSGVYTCVSVSVGPMDLCLCVAASV